MKVVAVWDYMHRVAVNPVEASEVWSPPSTKNGAFKNFGKQPFARIAGHYGWFLQRAFDASHHTHVVILEDDLDVADDFLTLFVNAAPQLDADETLMCVSAWNDNGFKALVAATATQRKAALPRTYRTGT
jgi:hypothetical protein